MKVLVSDKLSEAGVAILKQVPGVTVDFRPGLGKDIPALKEALKDADAIAIRRETKLNAELLSHAPKLKVIGRAGIGVDNVDLEEASRRGIIVMNTPHGNTVTTAEHAISMMCALTRQIPQATASIKGGKWEKNRFMGSELYRKTLGIIGCGNIGQIVADRARGLRMNVIVYDPFVTDEFVSKLGGKKLELNDLFKQADYITIHVPKNERTNNLINAEAFAKMKKGVFIINCARGGIVNEKDLVHAIESGIVAGAALDVFEKEPVDPAHPLLKLDQVICTPHLGASTDEAQENVAVDVARQIAAFLSDGTIQNAINVPSVSGEMLKRLKPYLLLAEKIGSLQGQLAKGAPEEVIVEYAGDISELPIAPLTIDILRGLLEPVMEDVAVNYVNARVLAKQRGIKVIETKSSGNENFSSLMTVTVKYKGKTQVIAGTIFGKTHPRIVRFNDYYLEAVPEGKILVVNNIDQPGVVGNFGTLLAKNKINISRMQLGLNPKTKEATAFYGVEGEITPQIIAELAKVPGIISVDLVKL